MSTNQHQFSDRGASRSQAICTAALIPSARTPVTSSHCSMHDYHPDVTPKATTVTTAVRGPEVWYCSCLEVWPSQSRRRHALGTRVLRNDLTVALDARVHAKTTVRPRWQRDNSAPTVGLLWLGNMCSLEACRPISVSSQQQRHEKLKKVLPFVNTHRQAGFCGNISILT